MSPKDKKFFTGFIIACIICIILVKVIFLRGTSRTSASESIIEDYTGFTAVSIFHYENKDNDKVCAFKYTGEDGKDGIGIAVLKNNMRGSYTVEEVSSSDGADEIAIPHTVVNDTDCAVIAADEDSKARYAETKVIYIDTGKENTLRTSVEPGRIAFIAYAENTQVEGSHTVTILDGDKNEISSIGMQE